MEILTANAVNIIFFIVGLIIFIGIIRRLLVNYFGREKQVKATVVNKQSYERRIYRKSEAPFTKKEYVITFKCNNKKLHFKVSEYSYGHYKINQKGTLRYKGNRIIDFK